MIDLGLDWQSDCESWDDANKPTECSPRGRILTAQYCTSLSTLPIALSLSMGRMKIISRKWDPTATSLLTLHRFFEMCQDYDDLASCSWLPSEKYKLTTWLGQPLFLPSHRLKGRMICLGLLNSYMGRNFVYLQQYDRTYLVPALERLPPDTKIRRRCRNRLKTEGIVAKRY